MGHSFKFIHCSDLHLGCTFAGISNSDPELGKKMKDSLFIALDNIVKVANKESVDFVIFSGDIFDSVNETPLTRKKFIDALVAIKNPCFIAYGNHDIKRNWEETILLPENAYAFPEEVKSVYFNKDGKDIVEIIGASFSSKNSNVDITKNVKKESNKFAIGVFHCNVNGYGKNDEYAPCSLSSLTSKDIDYWALGHIHKREVLNKSPYVVYSGNTQGLDHKESGEKGAYLVTVENDMVTDMKFFRTGPIIWEDIVIDITGKYEFGELFRNLTLQDGSIVSITFTGRGKLDAMLRIEMSRLKELIENTIHHTVSRLDVNTVPDFNLEERENVGDFISAVLNYRKKLMELPREELLKTICYTEASVKDEIGRRFREFSDDELRKIIDDSTYLIVEKIMEAGR